MKQQKKYLAETIGIFTLIFCRTGALTNDEIADGNVSHIGIAIIFGLVVMFMILAFSEKSGAHLNPAVSNAFCIKKSLR